MLATPPSLPTFLQTLQSHYCPAVSKLLRKLLNPAHTHNKTETHLGKYLDIDNEQVSQFLSYQLQSLFHFLMELCCDSDNCWSPCSCLKKLVLI